MALTTRCPHCGTAFKVVPDQLRIRNGLVRCGACSTVFDGRASLVQPADVPGRQAETPVAMPAATAARAAEPAHAVPPLVRPETPTARASEPVPPWEDEPAFSQSPARPWAQPPSTTPPAVLRSREQIRRQAQDQDARADELDDDELLDDELHDDESQDDEPRGGRRHGEDGHDDASGWRDRADERYPHSRPAAPRFEERRGEAFVADDRRGEPSLSWSAPVRAEAVREPALRARVEDDGALDDGRGHADEDATDFEHADGDALQDGAPVLGESRTRYSSATDVGRAPPEFLDQDRQARRGLLRRLWGYGCLLGLIALGLQLLYAYRVDIANSVPALRPALEAACRSMGCTVGYARRLERIAISASSLQPPPGAAAIDDGRSRLVLNLMLRNRYDKPQHWPALVLDLTDLSDTVVVRKVLRPEDYLTPEQLRGPFGPAGELKISVPIEVAGVQVNGYQLDKFFP